MEQTQPTSIGKYDILSVIGRGGMGVVYRAQDPLMGRQVAIKTVTEEFSKDASMLQRFYGEAEKMGMLRHPNIVTVYDLGEQNGLPYIVMELVEGDPLDRLIQAEQPIPLYSKLHIMEQVCGALAYAHQNGLIHRDVKPANVIVRPDGVAKLLDFGIARQEDDIDRNLTATGGVIGTVPYMAPERLKGSSLDGRSDIFAAGVLLYQFLAGRLPFTGKEYVLVNQLLHDQHPPLSDFVQHYPRALDGILDRALAKVPAERYQSADDMADDLLSVVVVLKQEQASELMDVAQKLSSEGDYFGAQNVLLQLLKLDTKNTQARAMAKEISLRVTLKARAEQAAKKQLAAQEAIRDRKFDHAIRLLEDALNLVPDDVSLASQLETAREKKQTSAQVFGFLQQADAARSRGDFTSARQIVEKAIQLDTSNSRLRAAYQSLVRQAEDAARLAKLQQLLSAAQNALKQEAFEDVLELTRQTDSIDPENLELKEIARAAKEGIYQRHRRNLLHEIEDQIVSVATREDAERVARVIYQALENAPADAVLLRYQAQVDRTLHELRAEALVDETVRECGAAIENAPLDALERVRQILIEVPGNQRLIELESRIQQRIEHMSTEEARVAILLQAREVLKERRFANAVEILERCRPPILTQEISELLDYARQESQHEEQKQLIARSCAQAQSLLREEKYEELVHLFTPIAQTSNDTRLQSMIDQAQRLIEERRAEQTAAHRHLEPFANAECYEQVVALARSFPCAVSDSAEIQALMLASQNAWTQEWTSLEALGRAYASLEAGDMEAMQSASDKTCGSAIIRHMQTTLSNRRTSAVDQVLLSQVKHIQEPKDRASQIDPARELAANRKLLPFASDAVKAEWSTLADRFGNKKKMSSFFTRLGKRSS